MVIASVDLGIAPTCDFTHPFRSSSVYGASPPPSGLTQEQLNCLFFGNHHRLHGSQSVQLSSLAGILTVNVSFGGVPVQDFKTALPPAPVQEPHCAEGQLPKLASFTDPACRGPKARGRFGIIALQ